MWTRAFIKEKARQVLRSNYWKAFLVSIVIIIAGGGYSNSRINYNYNNTNHDLFRINIFPPFIISTFDEISLFFASAAMLILILRVFAGYMLEVGGRKFFIKAAEKEDSDLNYIGYCFQKDRYFNVLFTMLTRSIFTFLWTLLLIIPGIIKSFAYSMVPYILADNPSMDYKRVIDLSVKMTDGHKWNMFVLDLSFLGWYILGLLAFVIGTLFVHPYANATYAELYLILRQNAIDEGITTSKELNIETTNIY
ncbi:MAG: hypothetical protein K0R54_504 [Clostridiaceae bacterium]|nr:hypothetical protein [Clostridiaceae bacterium]